MTNHCRPCCRFRPVPFVELVSGAARAAIPTVTPAPQGDDGEMFTIEEDSGTYTGSIHPHNGYYAADFTRNPTRTASEPAALTKLRRPTVPIMSGTAH